MRAIVLACAFAVVAAAPAGADPSPPPPAAEVYLAPDGVDAPEAQLGRDCVIERPCRTLAKARDVVAAAIAKNPDRDYKVLLRGGVYPLADPRSDQSAGDYAPAGLVLTALDAVGEGRRTTYAGFPGETAVVSGGRDLSPSSGWKWREADMAGVRVWTSFIPEVAAGRQMFGAIWVNGRRAGWTERGLGGPSLARTPFAMARDGELTAAGPLRPTATPDMPQPQNDGDRRALLGQDRFFFNAGGCAPFPAPPSAELCGKWSDVGAIRIQLAGSEWYQDIIPLASIDDAAASATLRGYGGVKQGGLIKGRAWWRRNVCEDLLASAGGTIYLVRAGASACGFPAGTLIYKPREGERLEAAQIVAPVLNTLVLIANSGAADAQRGAPGFSRGRPVGRVAFENLTFAYSNSTIHSGFASYSGKVAGFIGGSQDTIYAGALGAIVGVGAVDVVIDHSVLKHFSEGAAIFPGGSRETFSNNVVEDVGGQAFGAGESYVNSNRAFVEIGPMGVAPTTRNDHSSGNLVLNNRIEDCGRLVIGAACIAIPNGHDNVIAFNSVLGSGAAAIALGGSAGTGEPGQRWRATPWTAYQPNQYNNYIGYNRLDSQGSLIDVVSGATVAGAAQLSDWGAIYNNQAHCGANQPETGYRDASGADAGAPYGLLVEYNYISNLEPGKWPIAEAAPATGEIVFAGNPSPGQSVAINGVALVFAEGAGRREKSLVPIGATLARTLDNLVGALRVSPELGLAVATYAASGSTLKIKARFRGAGGNAVTIAASDAKVSGPTLAGGAERAPRKGGHDGVPLYFDTNASACVTISKNIVTNVRTNRILQLTGHLFEVRNNIFWQDFVWSDGSPRVYMNYPSSGPVTLVESDPHYGPRHNGLEQVHFHHNVVMLGTGPGNVDLARNYPLWTLAVSPDKQEQTRRFENNVYCDVDPRRSGCLPLDFIQKALGPTVGTYPLKGDGPNAWTTTLGQDAGSTFDVLPTCPDAGRGDFSTCSGGMPPGFESPYSPAPQGARYPGRGVAEAGARDAGPR